MNEVITPEENWVKLAPRSDIKGEKRFKTWINKTELTAFEQGSILKVVNSICPHMGGPLEDFDEEPGKVRCPWHGWMFDIKSGVCNRSKKIVMKEIPHKIINGEVWVDGTNL